MCFILSLSGVEVIPEYWTSSRDVDKVLNTSPATLFIPNKLHNLVARIFPSSHCLLAAFSALLIGARIGMKFQCTDLWVLTEEESVTQRHCGYRDLTNSWLITKSSKPIL